MSHLFITFSFIIVQLLIIGMLYKLYKSIAHPNVFFQSYMTIHIILSLLAFSDFDFYYIGLFWILFSLFLFSIGSLLASGLIYKKIPKLIIRYSYSIKTGLAKVILLISILLGILYSVEFIIKNEISLTQLLDLNSLLEINHSMAVQRYSGSGQEVSKFSRLFLVFVYFAPLIGGFNLNFFKSKRDIIICWLSILPSLLIIFTQNTKTGFIASVFLFVSGYITSSIKLNQKLPKISFKKMVFISIGILMFLLINYVSMMMRIGRFDVEIIDIVNNKFIVYALGHIPAFDTWFANHVRFIEYNFGAKTFYGITDFFGLSERIQGIYTDTVNLGSYWTNVYTAFRPFIEDFGPYLGLALMFLYGFGISWIFINEKRKNSSFIGTAILASFYFYTLYGTITSPWAYMSYILTFILFEIYVQSIFVRQDKEKAFNCPVKICQVPKTTELEIKPNSILEKVNA